MDTADFSYLDQPLSSRLPCYGMAIGRGYSVHTHSDNHATYVKDGVLLEIRNVGIFATIWSGCLSLVTASGITVSTNYFDIPNKNFDAFEASILSVQLVLREAGLLP